MEVLEPVTWKGRDPEAPRKQPGESPTAALEIDMLESLHAQRCRVSSFARGQVVELSEFWSSDFAEINLKSQSLSPTGPDNTEHEHLCTETALDVEQKYDVG